MASDPKSQGSAEDTGDKQAMTGPFVLRTLLDNVPLSEDGDDDQVKINCVDYFGKLQFSHVVSIAFCSLLTDRFRRQPLHRHLRLRASPFRPDPPRSCRQVRPACLHPCFEVAPKLRRELRRGHCETGSPANHTVNQDPESVRALQQYRHLLRVTRAQPRIWNRAGQKLLLDWRLRSEPAS